MWEMRGKIIRILHHSPHHHLQHPPRVLSSSNNVACQIIHLSSIIKSDCRESVKSLRVPQAQSHTFYILLKTCGRPGKDDFVGGRLSYLLEWCWMAIGEGSVMCTNGRLKERATPPPFSEVPFCGCCAWVCSLVEQLLFPPFSCSALPCHILLPLQSSGESRTMQNTLPLFNPITKLKSTHSFPMKKWRVGAKAIPRPRFYFYYSST